MRMSLCILPALFGMFFAIFPLTDTDIWWHLACAREWVMTWTPVRTPVINVHEYFQQVVGIVYGLGGAPLLVAFKALLWGIVFVLFLRPAIRSNCHTGLVPASPFLLRLTVSAVLLFIFRYHIAIRPVLFSLLFLGVYWNILPKWFADCHSGTERLCSDGIWTLPVRIIIAALLLSIQWFWCKCQGLYILGPIFATLVLCANLLESKKQGGLCAKIVVPQVVFVLFLFAMPFLHREGLSLFLYPFGLLDRLLGLTPSAAVFASEIAENRSPFTLLMAGENALDSMLMIVLCAVGMIVSLKGIFSRNSEFGIRSSEYVWLGVTTVLACVAERNFVLFLPVLLCVVFRFLDKLRKILSSKFYQLSSKFRLFPLVFVAFLLGLWGRTLYAYDASMVAYQRVPVQAATWMAEHPHAGRLFNDDRAGGYLAFVNPADSIYIDGRFILKTADFFERYLAYAQDPSLFMLDADSLGIDRAVFPLQYYARWDSLLLALDKAPRWHLAYRDEYFAVFDRD